MSMIQTIEFNAGIDKATLLDAIELCVKKLTQIETESETIGGRKWAFSQYRKEWKHGKDLIPPRRLGVSHREYATEVGAQAMRLADKYPVDVIKSMIVLAMLRLEPEAASEYKKQSHEAIVKDMHGENRRAIVSVDGFIAMGRSLLVGRSYLDRILGLCALTGRRTREIGCTAVFERVDDAHVRFTGQLKTKGRTDVESYVIPVLSDADRIINALATIREDKPELADDPELFHARCSKDLHTRAVKHFSAFYSDGYAKPKDLRPAYAEICWVVFDEYRTAKPLYFSRLLGHGDDDVTTALSYDDLIIDDPEFS